MNAGTVRYTREERAPDKAGVRSRRRLYVCGEHDYAMRRSWAEQLRLLELRGPVSPTPPQSS
jgi:hypothetical protein